MEEFKNFWENISKTNLVSSIIVIAISIILYKIVVFFLSKGEEKNKQKNL